MSAVEIAPEYAERLVAYAKALAAVDAEYSKAGVDLGVMAVDFYLAGSPAPYRIVWSDDYSGYVIRIDGAP